ncbi:MAG TPA: penicillin-binding protein activator [Candidatus Saccharimonadia bacterium]|nr:penicillin-binding protein activator [Candidatus Saccharimonadia bacterium]
MNEDQPSLQPVEVTPPPSLDPVPPPQPTGKSKTMLWIASLVAAILVVGGGAWWYVSSHRTKPVVIRNVKVGLMTPLQGVYTNSGTSIESGVQFAQQQLSAKGLNVTLLVKDTNCEGTKAVQAVKDFAAQGVVAIVGDVCSSATLAAIPVATQYKIPMVSPSSTNPSISQTGQYMFRTVPSDAFSADFAADLIYTKEAHHKLAIIHGDEAYGTGLNTAVSASFQKLGGTVVASESFVNESTNVATQVAHIKAAKPDALYIGSNSLTSAIAVLDQLQSQGVSLPIYSAETLKDPTFLKDVGTQAEGLKVIAVSEGTPAYVEKSYAKFGKDPDIYNAQSYDAYQAIFEALKTGANSGEAVMKALHTVSFDGASGRIKFDAHGDVAPNYTVYKVVNGVYKAQN